MPRPTGATQGKIQLDKNSLKTAVRMFSFIRGKNLVFFIFALLGTGVAAYVSVQSNLFLQVLIDDFIAPLKGQLNPDLSGLVGAIMKIGSLYLISIAVALLYNLALARVTHGVLKDIRDTMFAHMQTLPVRFFDTNSTGNLMSRFTNDIDTMRQMLSQSLPQVLSSMFSIVMILIAMIKLSWRLTLVVLCFVVLMYAVTMTIGGKSAMYFKARQKSLGLMNGYIEEMINGQKVIKVFNHEKQAKKDFDERNEDLCDKTGKANAYAMIIMPITGQLGNLQYVVLAAVGGFFALHGIGNMSLGMIASFLLLSKNFNQPVSQITQQINSVVMALAGAQRVFDLMDEKPEQDYGTVSIVQAKEENGKLVESEKFTSKWAWKVPKEDGFDLVEVKGDIRMNNLDFGYTKDKTVLHEISLFAKPGQKIAFVGSTGAGKTTITNVINRFYYVPKGCVTFDGIDINDIKKPDLRSALGQVLQDTNLFTGTIKENIRYGRLNATDRAVEEAAKLANADEFIRLLPNGYDTVINGTGSQLSQGQCQLLSIARSAIKDPAVMILDEATSSIDTRTERLVQEGMDRLMHGRTTFVIAHRLSTIQDSNAIMVLEGGKIIERGDHDDLIAQRGRYYELYTGNKAN